MSDSEAEGIVHAEVLKAILQALGGKWKKSFLASYHSRAFSGCLSLWTMGTGQQVANRGTLNLS